MSSSFQSIISFLTFLTCCTVVYAQEWQEVSSLPGPARHHPITFSLDGQGYVLTGGSLQGLLSDFYRYDPVEDAWTQLPDFPGGERSFAYGVTYDGKAYVGFGNQSDGSGFNGFNDLWRYDPGTEEWAQMADCRCSGRAHPAMVAAEGRIFVGLGNEDFGADLDDWWEYDIATNTWSEKPRFPSTRRHHPFYFDIDGMVYVGFGHHAADIFNDMYRYDPLTEEWTKMADLPAEGRVAGTQFSLGGRGYLLSGDGDDHSFMDTGEFWEYDPSADAWTALPPHPGSSRWAPGSFVVGNELYFLAGLSQSLENDLWVYEFDLSVNTKDVTESTVALAPNPASDVLHIHNASGYQHLQIVAISGVTVISQELLTNTVDVSVLPTGRYTAVLTGSAGTEQLALQIVR